MIVVRILSSESGALLPQILPAPILDPCQGRFFLPISIPHLFVGSYGVLELNNKYFFLLTIVDDHVRKIVKKKNNIPKLRNLNNISQETRNK